MKRIESACLAQQVLFDSAEEWTLYKKQLERKRIPYCVESEQPQPNGTLLVRMKRRYVHYSVGDYLKETERG